MTAWPFADSGNHVDVDQVLEPRPFPIVDLAAVAAAGIPEPTLLFHGLLYRGMLHSLAGPPDCGKSTLAHRAALQLLREGEAVVMLDEEGGREVVAEKFLALGASPAELKLLYYVEFPSRSWDEADRAGLAELLGRVQPVLVVVDSAGAFMAVAGRDENWAADVGPFYRLLLGAAREHHTAVLVLDHVPKNEHTGRYARGSGAKLQIVDVAFMVEAVRPFSRQQDGLLSLTVTKDRRGYLHRQHEIKVITEGGPLALEIAAVTEVAAGDPRTAALPPATRKVYEVLVTAQPDSLTVAAIGDLLPTRFGHSLKPSTIREALNALAVRQLADGEHGQGKGKRWWAT
jgi:hypothetical protein